MPKVSVVMPVFNGEKYLKVAIESILNQSFRDFELIIINDGSTDQTLEILNSYKDKQSFSTSKRIKLINNKNNLGVARSLNIGIKKARGEFIARADADDINMPSRFKKQVEFLNKNQNYILVGSNFDFIDTNDRVIKNLKKIQSIFPIQNNLPVTDLEIRRKMIFRNQILHPTVMFRKSALEKVGHYNEFLNGAEDYDLWFRMLKIGKMYNLEEKLILRRWHSRAVSVQNHLKVEFLALVVRLKNLFSKIVSVR